MNSVLVFLIFAIGFLIAHYTEKLFHSELVCQEHIATEPQPEPLINITPSVIVNNKIKITNHLRADLLRVFCDKGEEDIIDTPYKISQDATVEINIQVSNRTTQKGMIT